MEKKKIQKLTLTKKTLRNLDDSKLEQAAGGATACACLTCTAICSGCTRNCSICCP